MSLLETWRETAIRGNPKAQKRFWKEYFDIEKGIYEKLSNKSGRSGKGTVKELAESYGTDVLHFTGFLDGINSSLKESNNLEELKKIPMSNWI